MSLRSPISRSAQGPHPSASAARRLSIGSSREEHELSAGPVRRVAYIVDGISVPDERGFDLVSFAETQSRIRGQHLPVRGEHPCPAKGHQGAANVPHLNPTLDRAHAVNLRTRCPTRWLCLIIRSVGSIEPTDTCPYVSPDSERPVPREVSEELGVPAV